jgi:8-oxo-dGTP pyrophosphatase MutT (NUDIX family)
VERNDALDVPGGESPLGPDWVRGTDGMYFRRGARVILFDGAGRVLLARGHDIGQPQRSWWFTIGGGIGDGESERDAAVREVLEETGIRLDPAALVGPVLTRSAIFDFYRVWCRQEETFFLAWLPGARPGSGEGAAPPAAHWLSRDGWTALERDTVDEMRWFAPAELRKVHIEVYPAGLADLAEEYAAGWNGQVRHLGLMHD